MPSAEEFLSADEFLDAKEAPSADEFLSADDFLDAGAQRALPAGVKANESAGAGRGSRGGPTAEEMADYRASKRAAAYADRQRKADRKREADLKDAGLSDEATPLSALRAQTDAPAKQSLLDQPNPYTEPPQSFREANDQQRAVERNIEALKAQPRTTSSVQAADYDTRIPLETDTSLLGRIKSGAAGGKAAAGKQLSNLARLGAKAIGADDLADLSRQSATYWGATKRGAEGLNEDSVVTQTAAGLVGMLPLLVGSATGIAAMATGMGADATAEALDAGQEAPDAVARGIAFGLANALSMKVRIPAIEAGFAKLAAKAPASELGNVMADALVRNVGTMGAQTIATDLYDKFAPGGLRKDMTIGEMLDHVIQTAKVAALTSAVLPGAPLATRVGARGVRRAMDVGAHGQEAVWLAEALRGDVADRAFARSGPGGTGEEALRNLSREIVPTPGGLQRVPNRAAPGEATVMQDGSFAQEVAPIDRRAFMVPPRHEAPKINADTAPADRVLTPDELDAQAAAGRADRAATAARAQAARAAVEQAGAEAAQPADPIVERMRAIRPMRKRAQPEAPAADGVESNADLLDSRRPPAGLEPASASAPDVARPPAPLVSMRAPALPAGELARVASSMRVGPLRDAMEQAARQAQAEQAQRAPATPTDAEAKTVPPSDGARAPSDAPSDAPQDVPRYQDRDRSTAASVQQMSEIAADPDPWRLGFSRDFATGAPVVLDAGATPGAVYGRTDYVVTSAGRRLPVRYAVVEADSLLPSHTADGAPVAGYADGVDGAARVVAGNARSAGLVAAYAGGRADNYRLGVGADEALHGIDQRAIDNFRRPVLVREMRHEDVTANIGDESNTSGVADRSAIERAHNDSRRIDLAGLTFHDDGSLTGDTVAQFVNAQPTGEQTALRDAKGRPTAEASRRLMNAIFAAAYGSDRLLSLYAEAVDPEARTVMSALAVAAPQMMRLRGLGDLDVREIVTEAAEAAVNARRRGIKLADMAAQADMAQSADTRLVLRMFADNVRSAKRIGEGLRNLADAAYAEATKPAEDMLGAVPRRSREQVLRETFDDAARTQDVAKPGGPEPVERDAGGARADAAGPADGAVAAQERAAAGRAAKPDAAGREGSSAGLTEAEAPLRVADRPEALIAARKRESVLRSIRECLGA